jgi:hypothetical protein
MHELKINVAQYGTHEGLVDNIKENLARGLPELVPSICSHDGTFTIVGSGPSVKDHIAAIGEEATVVGVKGAYDYLVENDITPTFYLSVEPRNRPVTRPQKNSIFLLASRIAPEMFEALKDYEILMWNSWSVEYENAEFEGHLAIGGGTTSGLRAICIGYVLGFRNFHLYGFDSCLVDGEKRLGQGQLHEKVTTTDVIVGGRKFLCNMAMAQQADDFQGLYEFLPDIHITSFGDGLITAIIEERRRNGLLT